LYFSTFLDFIQCFPFYYSTWECGVKFASSVSIYLLVQGLVFPGGACVRDFQVAFTLETPWPDYIFWGMLHQKL